MKSLRGVRPLRLSSLRRSPPSNIGGRLWQSQITGSGQAPQSHEIATLLSVARNDSYAVICVYLRKFRYWTIISLQ